MIWSPAQFWKMGLKLKRSVSNRNGHPLFWSHQAKSLSASRRYALLVPVRTVAGRKIHKTKPKSCIVEESDAMQLRWGHRMPSTSGVRFGITGRAIHHPSLTVFSLSLRPPLPSYTVKTCLKTITNSGCNKLWLLGGGWWTNAWNYMMNVPLM